MVGVEESELLIRHGHVGRHGDTANTAFEECCDIVRREKTDGSVGGGVQSLCGAGHAEKHLVEPHEHGKLNECGDAASGDAVIVVFEKLTPGFLEFVVGFGICSVLELFFKLAEFWAQIHIDTTGPVLHPRRRQNSEADYYDEAKYGQHPCRRVTEPQDGM